MIDHVVQHEHNLPGQRPAGEMALVTMPGYAQIYLDREADRPNGRMALYVAGPYGWHFASWCAQMCLPGVTAPTT